MAAVLDQHDAAAKNGSQVDEQLAQATSRIRAHDFAFGALVLVALALVYTTAMILLDKYLALPAGVRQVALVGFVAALAGVAYLAVVRPLRRRINPLYAAKQVEGTIDDGKNSVTGYVDAQQKGGLNATVNAALARRAALAAADADVNKAVDHRSLVYLGGVAVALFLVLVVLFFTFRTAQFSSLVSRTFNPFASGTIKSRTQIMLLKPDPAEPTITTGQSVSVSVHVGGKVPAADGPARMRLMIRHNPLDPEYTELPLVQGDTNRDWELRVPDYLIQNGFWYKIAGGDAETPEYKVTVRSLPLFTDFKATYDYPKYLRRAPETANGPLLKGYRGTTVTLVARTNRDVRDGTMTVEPGGAAVAGTPVAGAPDSLRFQFKLTESGRYKLGFTAADGERTADPFQSTITVETDAAPVVVNTQPEADETELPANGLLAVDGKAGDDFGVDTVTLKMKLVSPVERPLPDKPFLNGKSPSFRRAKDDTWPTDVDYKDSVDLAKLDKDAAGLPLQLAPDMVIEYWLEAADNCTEPKPNVGRSAAKRVRLTPPKVNEQEKQNLNNEKEQRKNQEQKAHAQQQEKFNQEKREQPKNGEQQPKNGDKGDGPKDNPDQKGGAEPPKGGEKPKGGEQPKNGEQKKDNNTAGMGGMTDPMGKNDAKPDNTNPMPPPEPNGMGQPGANPPETAPPPSTPEQKDVQKKAEELQKAMDKENQQGGTAKRNDAPKPEERADPAQPKPQPPMGGMDGGGMAEQKPQPPADAKSDPMNGGAKPADAKPEGNVEKPANPAAPKPDPKQDKPAGGQQAAPSETRSEPVGQATGNEKPQPKDAQPQPKDPNQKQDPKSGSAAKPADAKPDEKGKNPAGDAGSKPKPMPEPTRGGDKNAPQPNGSPPSDQKPDGKLEAGDAKPEKAPPAAAPKPAPQPDMMNPGGGDMKPSEEKPDGNANQPTKPNGTGAAEAKPADAKPQPMGAGGKPDVAKGTDKPDAKGDDKKPQGGAGEGNAAAPKPKELSAKEKQELEQAAKDLTSSDPQKKQAAQQKLDKAIGEENRKEAEKLANDLQSPDKGKRDAAQKKLDDLQKQAQKGGGEPENKEAPKFDEKQMKEMADAMKDLQSPDPQKKQAAQQKLDKAIGEENRKEAEKLANDLQSDDKATKDAAEKKLDAMKKELDKQQAKKEGKSGDGKGKEPTQEELDALAKKAQDLQSKDDKTREQAEKELDEKIGKENREKLQDEMKGKQPGDAEADKKLKEEVEQMAKEQAKKQHDPTGKGLGTGAPLKAAMEDDPKNRLKTAELRLEDFEKKKYDEAFKRKQGFTDAEYEKFLRGYERYVEQLRADALKAPAVTAKPPGPAGPAEAGGTINAGAGSKVESKAGPSSGAAGGATVAPPGFEDARRRFEELLKEKK